MEQSAQNSQGGNTNTRPEKKNSRNREGILLLRLAMNQSQLLKAQLTLLDAMIRLKMDDSTDT